MCYLFQELCPFYIFIHHLPCNITVGTKLSHNIKSSFLYDIHALFLVFFPTVSHFSCLIADPHVIVTHIEKVLTSVIWLR